MRGSWKNPFVFYCLGCPASSTVVKIRVAVDSNTSRDGDICVAEAAGRQTIHIPFWPCNRRCCCRLARMQVRVLYKAQESCSVHGGRGGDRKGTWEDSTKPRTNYQAIADIYSDTAFLIAIPKPDTTRHLCHNTRDEETPTVQEIRTDCRNEQRGNNSGGTSGSVGLHSSRKKHGSANSVPSGPRSRFSANCVPQRALRNTHPHTL